MPETETIKRAQEDAREGKSPSTQAGEFVREEIHHIREGKHGAASAKQAIAIGLSKARRAGVKLGAPKGKVSPQTKAQAARDSSAAKAGAAAKVRPSRKRSQATSRALKSEGGRAASPSALSRHAKSAARKRSSIARRHSAQKAAQTRKRGS
jgi:hypothetical protein